MRLESNYSQKALLAIKSLEDRLKFLEGMGKIKSIDNLSDRLHRLEVEREVNPVHDDVAYATAEELQQMTPEERYEAWFNWHVREIIPYYKTEVMRLHNISDEEYNRRTLEGDESNTLRTHASLQHVTMRNISDQISMQ